ncbi:hypothetical protein Ahy_B10g105196 [Arachis hypogaea]|uniref:Uncharacterized protein n=1 Tax=Arachis hypogaea TaxID=3818 RepID=A0A444X7G0_ARAHY|nr:hypothetical protein Ahy_B10g105196 [Arachis hypogaea]
MSKKRRYLRYNEAEMSREYDFRVRLEFKSLTQFKNANREHVLLNGRDIRNVKNDKRRGDKDCNNDSDIQADKHIANISVTKAYWVRINMRKEVHDKAILQYAKLRDYFTEIMRTNFRIIP